MEDIKVSVCCLVYNHEKYLRQCLDSILMQETNFKYEILIHDDASTDGSVDIIREYERKYPDIIKPLYQKENQYSKGVKISWTYQYPRAKGKYIALCEGDDFWNNKNKLQRQADMMDKKDDLSMCVHDVLRVLESGQQTGEKNPPIDIKEGILSSMDVLKMLEVDNIYPFHTSSYFFRATYIHKIEEKLPEFFRKTATGDVVLMVYLATKGDFGYIKQSMSSNRINSIGSWTESQQKRENRIAHFKSQIETKKAIDEYLNYKFTESIAEQILGYEFDIYRLENRYSMCLKKKYKQCMNKLPLKEQIYIKIFGRLPVLFELYVKIRG
ncbi:MULTISPECIES: glycosyltransferase family 2 protein [Bacillota]|uniref:glycosyltransferase family 2 protein n=1 Tax=Holdemanella sp. TaxID=1971762 RepID=UPI0024307CE3|nr:MULTISPECIES: glycosyltransferase [Bacillota]